MASKERFTATELVEEGARRGFESTERLITDWVGNGLLDSPQRHSLGRGRGSAPGTWPDHQRQLFLLLLEKRGDTKRIRALCNLPVALWLYFGDLYVGKPQLRRALATFAGATRTASARAARQSAKEVSKLLLPPDLSRSRRKELKDSLTEAIVAATGGAPVDLDRLREAAHAAFDPDSEGRIAGPSEARVSGNAWIRTLEARLKAIALIEPDHESPADELLEDVRLAHHQVLISLAQRQPELKDDPEVGGLFGTPTFEALVNSACLDLVTGLGFLILDRDRPAD